MEVTKANLATYLAGLAPSATPYPIEITETVAGDWFSSGTSGTVGNIINNNTPSGVYLDLGLTIIPNSVTIMEITFRDCTALTTAPVIPNSVTNMYYTFYRCTALTTAPVIPSNVTNMESTFFRCTALTTAPIIPSSVISLFYAFFGCTALTTAPIIPSSVTDMRRTFAECTSLTTAPIIPSSVTNMVATFNGCTALHTIQNFAVDVDNCDMTDAFWNCPALANIYVTTLSESTWHLLHTNTGATGTDYTIYNPDGTVAGSGTVAGTNQVLTLYGKSDELVISANITPTLAVETATSQVQWHKSGLPYDDELMIFNAKNPDTVISNFITVNRAGEEFLGNSATATLSGKSKDSYPIPTDAVLQYSFDEIKQLPDNPAGTVYKRDNDWTTVDGWSGNTVSTISVENNKLKASFAGGDTIGASIYRAGTNNGKFIVGKVQSQNAITNIKYHKGTIRIDVKKIIYITPYEAYFVEKITSTFPYTALYINEGDASANTVYFESLYIGDGSYLDPVIDNSYSEAHAENHGVIPVDGVCGKAGYFNNSYMIAPRPTLGDDITIYFWAKFDALGTQTIVQSRTVEWQGGLSVFQITNSYRLVWRENPTTFTGYTPPVNTWHHVCVKMNATTKVLKINGEVKSTLTGTYGATPDLASNIWSGMSGTGGTLSGQILTGALDGLKIVPRFTTDDEDTGEYKARANHPKFYTTADKWKTARNITISDADGTNKGTAVSVDGSENETLKLPATIKASLTGNASTATLATQADAIKPLGNSITLPATPTSVIKIIKLATVNYDYSGTINISCGGGFIADVIKVYIHGNNSSKSGLRVVYGKNNTTYGIKKIVVTSDTLNLGSPRQIYAEIVTRATYGSTTRLGVVEKNNGIFTPSMTEVSSVEGTVVDSLPLNYLRGDISSYQHEFTKNIIGNVTGNSATATKLQTARKINGVNFDGTADVYVDGVPIGTIIATVSDTPDIGYAFCHGQALSRQTYATLFSKIGTKYGVGNGSTTFNLPDCREVSLVGAGTNVLNSAQIEAHDALTVGQFQDDEFKKHLHGIHRDTGGSYDVCKSVPSGLTDAWYKGAGFNTLTAGSSATTHGKQLGVNYQIKISN